MTQLLVDGFDDVFEDALELVVAYLVLSFACFFMYFLKSGKILAETIVSPLLFSSPTTRHSPTRSLAPR